MARPGLYANIHDKRDLRKKGAKASDFKEQNKQQR